MRSPTIGSRGQVQFASGVNILAGLWEIAAPFIWQYSGTPVALWNDVIVGVVVAVLAAIRAFGAFQQAWSWLSWINAAIGVWLIVAPFVLGYFNTTGAAEWNDIIVGAIIVILGAWSALVSPRA